MGRIGGKHRWRAQYSVSAGRQRTPPPRGSRARSCARPRRASCRSGRWRAPPSLKALSWAAMYSAYCPAMRGYCAGMPAPAGPWQPAQAGTPVAALPPRQSFWPSAARFLSLAAAGLSFWPRVEGGQGLHVGVGEVRHHAHHDRALARRLLAALRLEVGELLVQVLGDLAGDFGIGRRGAVAVGGMARGAHLVGDALRLRRVLRRACAATPPLRRRTPMHVSSPGPRTVERRDFIRIPASG